MEQHNWAISQRVEATDRLTTLGEELRLTLEHEGRPEPPVEADISKYGIPYTYSQYLQSELADTEVYIARLTTITSPFRRLHSDILELIFKLTFDMVSPAPKRVDPIDEDSLQWRLARVCRAWCNVAFSIPRFWNTLEFDFTRAESGLRNLVQGDRKIAFIAGMLQRSSPIPLSITIFAFRDLTGVESGGDGGVRYFLDHPIVHLLIPESDRWQHLTLNGKAYVDLMRMPTLQHRLPSLESMRIEGGFTEEQAAQATGCEVLQQSAPRLLSVDAHRIDLSILNVPFPQLSFVRGTVTADLSHGVLSQTSNLTRADIAIVQAQSAGSAHTAATCTVPLLRDLSISICVVPVRLITPSLQVLRMPCELLQFRPVSMDALSRLQELYLRNDDEHGRPLPVSAMGIVACLRLTPQLKVLSLSRLRELLGHLYVALTPKPYEPVLCPNLEIISIENEWLDITPAMVAFIERRGEIYANSAQAYGSALEAFSALRLVKLRGVYPQRDRHRLNALLELRSPQVDY